MPTSATVTAECPRHDSFEHDRGSFDAAINETEEKEADRKLTQNRRGGPSLSRLTTSRGEEEDEEKDAWPRIGRW